MEIYIFLVALKAFSVAIRLSVEYLGTARFKMSEREPPRGGVTPIYNGLDRYVPPDRVWFLRVSILK